MYVIPTLQAEHLTAKLQSKNISIILPSLNRDGKRHFPDGELYVKIPLAARLAKKHAVVLHSGAPNPNEGLIELELILQILKEVKASPIDVFFTYFPYGMQDEIFAKGETNVAENLIGKLVNYYNVRTMYILDAHFAGKKWHAKYPLELVSAVPQLVENAMADFGSGTLFLSPDKGGARRTQIKSMQKKRMSSYEVEIRSSAAIQRSIKNRTVAVVDDLIETGGTLDRFYNECKKSGAQNVVALLTHGVLPAGISRIKKKYTKLYLTNSINRKESNVDITPLIRESLL